MPSPSTWAMSHDADPAGTRELLLVAMYRRNAFLTARQWQGELYGTDNYGSSQTQVALRALVADGLVSKQRQARHTRYGFTPTGALKARELMRAQGAETGEWVGFDDCPYLVNGGGCGWPTLCVERGACPDVDKIA